MYTDILTTLDLTKNESKIYEVLLKHGETAVGNISTEAQINRRNVYDSLNRLIEKGLIFEIRQGKENLYQAVDPKKLMEAIKEKELALESIMPDLQALYISTPHQEDVYIYRGLEGWKNYMRDILRVNKDVYVLGGKGAWADKKIVGYSKQFFAQAKKQGIKFHVLFDHQVKETHHEILDILDSNYRFLPKGYSTSGALDIFGDYVVILSHKADQIDDNASSTVIVNKNIADAFRTWFRLMWEMSSKVKSNKQ
jgi:sugar-specific transcriptional regulator TrmB